MPFKSQFDEKIPDAFVVFHWISTFCMDKERNDELVGETVII